MRWPRLEMAREWTISLAEDSPLAGSVSGYLHYSRESALSDAGQWRRVIVWERRVLRFGWRPVLVKGWSAEKGWDAMLPLYPRCPDGCCPDAGWDWDPGLGSAGPQG